MHDRRRVLVVIVAGAALLAFQAWAKPRPGPEELRQQAKAFMDTDAWRERVAPDFEVALLDGTTFHLQDHIGRQVVVLNFFATWCGPCRAEMPELERFHAAHDGDRLLLLGIDSKEKHTAVEDFIRETRVSFPIGLDGTGEIGDVFDVSAYPTTIVIGADGRVKLYQTGGISNAEVTLADTIAPQLAAIREGRGVTLDAYRQALASAPKPASGTTGPLVGRARRIAEAMTCPCGCDDKVNACSCNTSKSIRARLVQGGYDARTDAEVMRELNREFCVKSQ